MSAFALLLLATTSSAHAQDSDRWEFESTPADIRLHDFVELWNGAEFDTGWIPGGSPLMVRFQIESSGGAEVEMEGEAHMGWPNGLTVAMDPIADSGNIVVDAALEAVTSIRFDIDIYSWDSEIDRRGIDVEGEALFSPFLLQGDAPDSVSVLFEGDTNELLNWDFQVFTGVTAGIVVDLGPEAVTTFTGENWYIDGDRVDVAGEEAWAEPLGEAYQDVQVEFVGAWESDLDLVLNPVFQVCVDLIGCWDLVDMDIPIPLASDNFQQFFPSQTLVFPLPVMGDLPSRHDFGTLGVGETAVLQLPIENIGALDLEGTIHVEGSTFFSVYPEYFQAGAAATDGVVVSYTPLVEGDFEAMLVLTSNDPLEPVIEIPLVASASPYSASGEGANGIGGSGDDGSGSGGRAKPQIIRTEVGGCGCASTNTQNPYNALGLVFLGGLVVSARRRRASR